jgi:hypothetical protein
MRIGLALPTALLGKITLTDAIRSPGWKGISDGEEPLQEHC